MLRLLLLTLLSWLALSALSGVVIAAGHAQPQPDVLGKYQIAQCGDRLCFRGMKPGVTTWADAHDAPGHQYYEGDPYRIYFPLENGVRVVFLVSVDWTKVDSLELDIFQSDHKPTLGTVLASFGPPCGVVTYYGVFESAASAGLVYPHLYIESSGLDLNDTVYDVFSTNSNQCDGMINPGNGSAYTPWLGIRSVNAYKARTLSNHHP